MKTLASWFKVSEKTKTRQDVESLNTSNKILFDENKLAYIVMITKCFNNKPNDFSFFKASDTPAIWGINWHFDGANLKRLESDEIITNRDKAILLLISAAATMTDSVRKSLSLSDLHNHLVKSDITKDTEQYLASSIKENLQNKVQIAASINSATLESIEELIESGARVLDRATCEHYFSQLNTKLLESTISALANSTNLVA